MALADTLAESDGPFSPGHIEQVVTQVIGQDVRFGATGRWRKRLGNSWSSARSASAPTIDAAAGALRDLYRDQGLLLGMDPSEFLLMTRPSQVVEAVVNHLSERLSREADVNSLGDDARAFLARVPHELEAVRFPRRGRRAADAPHAAYLAPSPGPRPDRPQAPRAEAVADILNAEPDPARDATHVLQQLRRGEERILRLWMLRNQGD